MLRLLVEKTGRCARRVGGSARVGRTTGGLCEQERYRKARRSFERCVGMLRREVVRGLRGGVVEVGGSRMEARDVWNVDVRE